MMVFGMPDIGLYIALSSLNSNREEEPPIQTSPIQLENATIIMDIFIITIIIYQLNKLMGVRYPLSSRMMRFKIPVALECHANV